MINKEGLILEKVYFNGLENEFFKCLFKSNEPFVLADASNSLSRMYDIKKSYEIMCYLKNNAMKLVFSENSIFKRKIEEEQQKRLNTIIALNHNF